VKARFLYRAWKARFRGERGEIRALLDRLAPGDAAVDVGANKGAYLYWMRRAVGPGGSVIAFEPQPGLARYLEDMRARMAWDNVSIRDCALSDSSGRRVLHVPGWENSPGASLEALEPAGVAGNAERDREVAVDTLDRQLEDAERPRIALVKVDVEEGVVTGFGVAELFQRPEFDARNAWKLSMEVIDAGTRVPNDRNAVHLRALRVTCAV